MIESAVLGARALHTDVTSPCALSLVPYRQASQALSFDPLNIGVTPDGDSLLLRDVGTDWIYDISVRWR
jgi:hypothetical protein